MPPVGRAVVCAQTWPTIELRMPTNSNAELYNELKLSLPESTSAKRKIWAAAIVEKGLDIKTFSKLMWCENRIASRFLWLLSEIGEIDADKLLKALPFLLELSDEITHLDFKKSFATFWLIAGVPLENEARAIDLLFGWLQSPDTNVTTKSRALKVLFNITKKYPELSNELKLCLEAQVDANTKDFRKRAMKILSQLNQ